MDLYSFQKEALAATKDQNRVAYYMDMGLGKTFVGSEKLVDLDSKINLVVCQKSKIQDWKDHFIQNYHFQNWIIRYLDGCEDWKDHDQVFDLTDKKIIEVFLKTIHDPDFKGKVVGIINYDLIFRRPELKKLTRFTLMLDESSLIQNEKAKRSKFILNMTPENVILLSGTPTSGKYENLWSQVHLLGWGISNKLFLTQYVNMILTEEDDSGFRHWIVDPANPYKNVDRLKNKLREHGAFFLKTEEVLTLPEQTFIKIKVPVIPEYKKFRRKKLITIDGEELVGDSVLTERLYCRMLCGSYNKFKLEAFRDLVQSTKDRLLVFYNFNKELEKLWEIAIEEERPVSVINGKVKNLEAYENESDSITFIQYQAGSMGLNLQKANKIVYFTLTDKSELFEQSKKRIHRIGQNQPCFYYIMECLCSVDEVILETLEQRKDFTDELFKERMNGK